MAAKPLGHKRFALEKKHNVSFDVFWRARDLAIFA
jgi:hypothetical protein